MFEFDECIRLAVHPFCHSRVCLIFSTASQAYFVSFKIAKIDFNRKKSNTLSAQNWPLQQYWCWFHVFYKTISPFGQKIGPIWLMMALIYHRCHQTENVLDMRCADGEHFCILCVYERCAYSMVSLSLAFSSPHILRRLHRRQQSHTMHIAWKR